MSRPFRVDAPGSRVADTFDWEKVMARFAGRYLVVIGLLFVSTSGCTPPTGGNGNDNNANDNVNRPPSIVLDEPRAISGMVALPAGTGVSLASLKVSTALADAAVATDGSFTANVLFRTPTLLQVVDGSDRIVLLAFADPDAIDPVQIDARSTATALLYFAAGGYGLFPDSLREATALIAASQAAIDLTAAIEVSLDSDLGAIHDGDEALLIAIDAAAVAIAFSDSPRVSASAMEAGSGVAKDGTRLQTQTVSPLILIMPDANTRQSGVQVVQNPDGDGAAAINNFRRRAHLYAYKTATEDEDGVRSDITPPELIEDMAVPTTYRLELLTSLYNVVTGTAPFAPIQTPAFDLPHDSDVDKTLFEIVVVGASLDFAGSPVIFGNPQFAAHVSGWEQKVDDLRWETFLLDFFLPIIENLMVGAASGVPVANAQAAVNDFKSLMSPLLMQRGILVLRNYNDYRNVLLDALTALKDNAVFRSRVITNIQKAWATNLANQAQLAQLQSNLRRAASAAAVLRVITASMGAIDLGAVVKDLQASSDADSWQVEAVSRTVHINPTSTRVEVGETRNFTAMISGAPNATLTYVWSTSGNYGMLGDGITQGVEIESPYATVVYSSDPGAPNNARDTISVQVYQETMNGRLFLGEPEEPSEIIAQLDPVCDELDVAPYQSGCGSISLSNATITAGEFMTVTVNVNCGSAMVYCDYVAAGTLELDGVPSGGGGFVNLYGYDPPIPQSRGNGAGVAVGPGGHTIRFQIPLSAPNDCINIGTPFFGRDTAVGPWCFLGGGSPNTWSSVAHFRVRQSGL